MRKAGAFATLFFVLLIGLPSLAETISFQSGQELHEKCKDADLAKGDSDWLQRISYCAGYITAHFEALSFEVDPPHTPVTQPQLVAVVNKYLNAHPELWGKSAGFLVRSALLEAFPFTKKQ